MSVAIFTDNDFDKTNGVTTTLKALLRHAPPDLRVRIYTLSTADVDEPDYLALRSLSAPIPYYAEMQMYLPRMRKFRQRLAADGIRLLHLTTPGPAGLAARYFASHGGFQPGLRLVGSFHTNLAEYTTLLSGSTRLGSLMDEYMRWSVRRVRNRARPLPRHDESSDRAPLETVAAVAVVTRRRYVNLLASAAVDGTPGALGRERTLSGGALRRPRLTRERVGFARASRLTTAPRPRPAPSGHRR